MQGRNLLLEGLPFSLEHPTSFIPCQPAECRPEGRWRRFTYAELIARDKTSLDIFWLRDQSLTDLDNLPDPEVLALEIVENLEAGLESFRTIAAAIQSE